MEMNVGLPEETRSAVSEGLSRVLADTYALYLKDAEIFHWNVRGPGVLFSPPSLRKTVRGIGGSCR